MAGSGRLDGGKLLTVTSVVILVGTEVIGAALATAWALAGLLELGSSLGYALMGLFALAGLAATVAFTRSALAVEPVRGRG